MQIIEIFSHKKDNILIKWHFAFFIKLTFRNICHMHLWPRAQFNSHFLFFTLFWHLKRIFIGIVDAINKWHVQAFCKDFIKDSVFQSHRTHCMINYSVHTRHLLLLWQAGSRKSIKHFTQAMIWLADFTNVLFFYHLSWIKFMANGNMWNNHYHNE